MFRTLTLVAAVLIYAPQESVQQAFNAFAVDRG